MSDADDRAEQAATPVSDTTKSSDGKESPGDRRRKFAGWVIALALLGTCTAVGSVLVEFPITWPQTAWGVLLLIFGGSLLVFTAVVIPFLSEFVARIATKLKDLPEKYRRWAKSLKTPRRLITAVLAVLLVAGAAVVIHPPASPLDLEPGELTILSAFDESPSDPRRILINQWNETHPDNRVIIEDAPGEPDQQHERMVGDAKPDGSHEADVYVLDVVWMAEFIKNDYIRPLNESMRSSTDAEFLPNVLNTCRDRYGNKDGMWGLPLNSDAGLLFYRTGVEQPARWDDYLGDSAREALTRAKADPALDGGGVLQAATAAQFATEEILTVTALEAIWAAGGEVVNPDGKPVLDENGAVEFDDRARDALKNLSAAFADRSITLADAKDADEDGAIGAFNDGRTLFMRNWPVTYDKLVSSSGKDAVPFEVAALPGPSVLGGQNLAVSKWTRKPRAAQAFIEFLTNSSSQLILFEVGGFAPTRSTVYTAASQVSRPYAQFLETAVERARPRPVTPQYIAFSSEFRRGVLRALRNNGEFEPDFPEQLAASLK